MRRVTERAVAIGAYLAIAWLLIENAQIGQKRSWVFVSVGSSLIAFVATDLGPALLDGLR